MANAVTKKTKNLIPMETQKSVLLDSEQLSWSTLWWHEVKLMDTAVANGQMKLIRWLLLHSGCPEHGKWCASRCSVCSSLKCALPTPMITAIKKQDLIVLDLLLQHGGDVHDNLNDDQGNVVNALDVVCSLDDVKLLNHLRHHFQAFKDRNRRSLLHIACSHNARRCSEYLVRGLQPGCVNCVDGKGMTPLMYAIRFGPVLPKLLLEHNADVNVTTKQGSALNILLKPHTRAQQVDASLTDFLATVELLIERGAQVDLMASSDGTPLELIISRADVNVRAANQRHSSDGHLFDTVTFAALELIFENSVTRGSPTQQALCMTTVMKNIVEIFTYIRYASNHLNNAIYCLQLNHKIINKFLQSGFKTSTPANAGPCRRRHMEDLSFMETVINNMLALSSTLSRQPVIDQKEFIPIGNILLSILQDYIDHRVWIRPGILLNTLTKPHPRILPFTVLYMTRQSHREYQRTLTSLYKLRVLTSRSSHEGLIGTLFERVPSLTHVCRMTINNFFFSGRQCSGVIDTFDLPIALKEYLKFPCDVRMVDNVITS